MVEHRAKARSTVFTEEKQQSTTITDNSLFLAITKFGLKLQELETTTTTDWSPEEFEAAYKAFVNAQQQNQMPSRVEQAVIRSLTERAVHLATRKGVSL